MRQAVSPVLFQQLDSFREAVAEALNVALLVDFFATTLQATPISLPRLLPALLRRAPFQASPQP